jgi:hypothetical protein
MTIETKELSNMRDTFALASDDGQRINASDSRTIVVCLSEKKHTELLNILEHDYAGKEKHLDELCETMLIAGITARQRSIEYSKKTKANAELAKLVAECRNPEELAVLLTKLKARE